MLSLPIISFSSRNKALYVIIHRQPIKHKPGSALVGSSHPIFREGRKQEYFCEVRWLGRWVTGLPSRLGFVVRGLCLRLIRSEVEAPSSCMGFLGRVRHFAVWLMETGTAKGELKCRISAALSEWEMVLGPTPPAVVSAQDHFVWILCRTQVPEELFFFHNTGWRSCRLFYSRREMLGELHGYWSNDWKLCNSLHPNEHVK